MRRVLVILNLVVLASVLVAWPLSYQRCVAVVLPGGGGAAIDTGAYFFVGASTVAEATALTPCAPRSSPRHSTTAPASKDVQRDVGHADPSTTKLYDRRGHNPEKSASFFAIH